MNVQQLPTAHAAQFSADEQRRIDMTVGCRDCDSIPKVAGAGQFVDVESTRYQIMHNGLRVTANGYCGAWMSEVIRRLRGHHEPQEERVFHHVLSHCRPGTTMVELGSGWAYYSMWFARQIAGARLVCVEPDPHNLDVGQRNFRANTISGRFIRASVGRKPHAGQRFQCESGQQLVTPEVSVDSLFASERLDCVELLLADVQGAELAVLEGAAGAIAAGRIRFVLLATHHHSISGDPLMHQKCVQWIRQQGGHVLTAFNVVEGYSGDGFVAASFVPSDRSLDPIAVSRNYPSNSLFRELEYDLAAAQRQLAKYRRWFGWMPWR